MSECSFQTTQKRINQKKINKKVKFMQSFFFVYRQWYAGLIKCAEEHMH